MSVKRSEIFVNCLSGLFGQVFGQIFDQVFGQVFDQGFWPPHTVLQVLRVRKIQFCRFYRDEKYSFAVLLGQEN